MICCFIIHKYFYNFKKVEAKKVIDKLDELYPYFWQKKYDNSSESQKQRFNQNGRGAKAGVFNQVIRELYGKNLVQNGFLDVKSALDFYERRVYVDKNYSIKNNNYNKEKNNTIIVSEKDNSIDNKKSGFSELEIYPKFIFYLKEQQKIYSTRIDEHASNNSKNKTNKWLHPDIVGFKDLKDDGITDKVLAIFDIHNRFELFSYEIKKEISLHSVRENFFQCLSNSSWANYSYLVACDYDKGVLEELRVLCSSYNVGFIKFNFETPEKTEVIFEPKKKDLDILMMNRIYKLENNDINEYIDYIDTFITTGKNYFKLNNNNANK